MKSLIFFLVCIGISLSSILHTLERNGNKELTLQFLKLYSQQKAKYFLLDMTTLRHQQFKNGLLTLKVVQNNTGFTSNCNMNYSIGLNNFQDKSNYESYFTNKTTKNITTDINSIQTILFDTKKHSLSEKPYVIGRIVLLGNETSVENCESNFIVSNEVSVQPYVFPVSTNSTKNSTNSLVFNLYFGKDYNETRTFKFDMSKTVSEDNYTQNNSIILKGIKDDKVTTEPFKHDVTLHLMMIYKNASHVSKKFLLPNGSAAFSVDLDDNQSRGLDQILMLVSSGQTKLAMDAQPCMIEMFSSQTYSPVKPNPPGPNPPGPTPPGPTPKPQEDKSGLSSTSIVLIVIGAILLLGITIAIISKCISSKRSEPLLGGPEETSLQNNV